jgi:hypothetical protein
MGWPNRCKWVSPSPGGADLPGGDAWSLGTSRTMAATGSRQRHLRFSANRGGGLSPRREGAQQLR